MLGFEFGENLGVILLIHSHFRATIAIPCMVSQLSRVSAFEIGAAEDKISGIGVIDVQVDGFTVNSAMEK